MDSIRSVDEAPDIESAFRYLKSKCMYTDFHFISPDGLRYNVHKLLVVIHSHVLSKIIRENPALKDYRIENVGKLALQNMIRYFYGESVVLQSISDINETKAIAEKFDLIGLLQICKEKLSDIEVNVSNVLDVMKAADGFNNETKQNECFRLIGENQETVFQNQEFNRMQFEKVLNMFIKLKSMQLMTESSFICAAIRWFETNQSMRNKQMIKENVNVWNISLDAFLDVIVSHPKFFENTEISAIVSKIRSRRKTEVEPETQQTVNPTVRYLDIGTNTDNQSEESIDMRNAESATGMEVYDSQKFSKLLTIDILKEADGVNVYDVEKRVKITIQEKYCVRSIQVKPVELLKKGLLGDIMTQDEYSYTYSDVDISYQGIYYMLGSLTEFDETLRGGVEYVEMLKAASFFQLHDLSDKCVIKIGSIIDYDPLFLDGLRKLLNFADKFRTLLLTEPLVVILHPNFIDCSAVLITTLLEQNELKVRIETQLLLVVIFWLEAYNRKRWVFRDHILEKLAFENIPTPDFIQVVFNYPDFFTSEEQKYILAYRNAVGCEIKYFKEQLPPWYNFKSRKIT